MDEKLRNEPLQSVGKRMNETEQEYYFFSSPAPISSWSDPSLLNYFPSLIELGKASTKFKSVLSRGKRQRERMNWLKKKMKQETDWTKSLEEE